MIVLFVVKKVWLSIELQVYELTFDLLQATFMCTQKHISCCHAPVWFRFGISDVRVVRASASGAVDSALILRLVKPMTVKLLFRASLLDF